jgi:LmbE family N-acetylglucosaminyl deacetylase
MIRPSRFFALFLFLPLFAAAQKPAKPSAADLHQAIKKLNVLGSVLYVAAHPDDENQRFISYCANHKLFNVTYLSLTRGDGGQNLIGPEIRELLGVLRTEELLMARSIDGGKQRFSRANDFGFSKTPDETLRIWNKDAVLSDVVWAIRELQPDVLVNRFYHDKKYDTHGHHTSSAMLSVEAFDLAGNPAAYPEQLKYTEVWQPRRQFFNTSWWFFGGQEAFKKMDKSALFPLDLGVYLPLKGKSNNETASEARSMHRCQGFGSISTRGENLEYFDFIKGERPVSQDLFEGINTTWTRVAGGDRETPGKNRSRLPQRQPRRFRAGTAESHADDQNPARRLLETRQIGRNKRSDPGLPGFISGSDGRRTHRDARRNRGLAPRSHQPQQLAGDALGRQRIARLVRHGRGTRLGLQPTFCFWKKSRNPRRCSVYRAVLADVAF